MKTINILLIGNSYSEDLIMYVPEMGIEKSLKLNIHVLGYGGCSIDTQIEIITSNSNLYVYSYYDYKSHRWVRSYDVAPSEVFNKYNWDYIFIQQASFLASQGNSFKNLNNLINLVKSKVNSDKSKFVWQMTWEYPSYSTHEDFTKIYNNDSLLMYNNIINNVKSYILNNPNISLVIPSAVAIRYLKEYKSESEIYRDNVHLSYHVGRYVLSLLFIKVMFNFELENLITVPFSTPLKDKSKFIEIANKASTFKF